MAIIVKYFEIYQQCVLNKITKFSMIKKIQKNVLR